MSVAWEGSKFACIVRWLGYILQSLELGVIAFLSCPSPSIVDLFLYVGYCRQ